MNIMPKNFREEYTNDQNFCSQAWNKPNKLSKVNVHFVTKIQPKLHSCGIVKHPLCNKGLLPFGVWKS